MARDTNYEFPMRYLGASLLTLTALLTTNCQCRHHDVSPNDPKPGRLVSKSEPCIDDQRAAPASLCPAGRGILAVTPQELCPDLHEHGWLHMRQLDHCVYAKAATAEDVSELLSTWDEKILNDGSVGEDDFRTINHVEAHRGELEDLLGPAGATLEGDCMLLPAAPPTGYHTLAAIREPLAFAFEHHLAIPSATTSGKPVTVAVIDTAPADTASGAATHGKLMVAIIQMMAAGSSNVEVKSYPGLPRSLPSLVDLTHGGYYGVQSDVSTAIQAAVTDWRRNGRGGRLIINLSVGWEPGSANDSLVAAAIAEARCEGALVFAAAGNRHPRSCVTGPTAPATFVARSAPTNCRDYAFVGKPLVYAVNAVDPAGQLLSTSRPGSMAPLAALGLDAVVKNPWKSGDYLGPQSGTSVATAVVSGLAAVAWSNNPGSDPDAIVANLWKGGDGNGPVDYPLVSMATQRIVGMQTYAPNVPAPAPNVVPAPLDLQMLQARRESQQCPTSCGNETVSYATGQKLFSLPLSTWAVPQPDDVLCSTCKIKANKLYLSLGTAHSSDGIVDISVTFWNASNSSERETIHFGPPKTTIPDEPEAVFLEDNALCQVGASGPVPTSAWVDFVYEKTDSAGATTYVSLGNAIRVEPSSTCP